MADTRREWRADKHDRRRRRRRRWPDDSSRRAHFTSWRKMNGKGGSFHSLAANTRVGVDTPAARVKFCSSGATLIFMANSSAAFVRRRPAQIELQMPILSSTGGGGGGVARNDDHDERRSLAPRIQQFCSGTTLAAQSQSGDDGAREAIDQRAAGARASKANSPLSARKGANESSRKFSPTRSTRAAGQLQIAIHIPGPSGA